ncbi:carboxypeptidase-like regulatory domain-containing protein, partial [bacterium]|nr:carboxypeptidase-like regulatory domain-containing protein [bacterium]
MNRILLVILIPILLFPESTITIKGKVIDDISKEPIVGANVFIEDSRYGDATDSNGNYSIENIRPGVYNLSCSLIGYFKQSKTITIDEKLTEINISFDLEPFKRIPITIPDSLKEYHDIMSSFSSDQKLRIQIDSIDSNLQYVYLTFENKCNYPIFLRRTRPRRITVISSIESLYIG